VGTPLALEHLGHWRRGLERESRRPDLVRGREFERLKERQRFWGLNTPGPTPGRTLSRLTRHCLGGLDFVRFGLSVRRRSRIGIFQKNMKFEMDFIKTKDIYIYNSWSSNNHYINLTMIRAT
jgi:hypothetical protein